MSNLLQRPHDEAARRITRNIAVHAAAIDTDGRFVPPGAEATMRVEAWLRCLDAIRVFHISLQDERVQTLGDKLALQVAEVAPLARAEQLASWVEARVGPASAPAAQGFLAAERRSRQKSARRAAKRAAKLCARLADSLARYECDLAAPTRATFGQALGGHVRALAAGAVADLGDEAYEDATKTLRRLALIAEFARSVPEARTLAQTAGRAARMAHTPFDARLARKVLLAAGLDLSAEVVTALEAALAPSISRGAGELLLRQTEHAANALEGQTQRETERKYLLSRLPPATRKAPMKKLSQGYIPGQVLQERLRRIDHRDGVRFLRTVKQGRGLTRIELEEETTAAIFKTMWPLTRGHRVIKNRYAINDGALTWVIDEFTDRDLVLAEVELPAESISPPVPSWLAPHLVREVTDDAQFVNINLAR